MLHTSYLATHAVTSSLTRYADRLRRDTKAKLQGMLVKTLRQRIQTAEHILDTELHDPEVPVAGSTDAVRALRHRISNWDLALHAALTDRTPDPRVLLVSANVAAGLLRTTSEVVQRAVVQQTTDSFAVQTRLLPVLVAAIDSWDRSRETWRLLAPATSGISRPLANAAQRLYDALHDPALDTHPDSQRAMRLAIMATVEAAHLQLQATRRADLRGAASGVAALTREVFDHVPGARSLDMWHQLERLEGPSPISIPAPVRTELLSGAADTLSTTTAAASAGYALTGGSGGRPSQGPYRDGRHPRWHALEATGPRESPSSRR